MDVRPATPDDATAVAEVHVRSWQAAYRGLLPEDVLASLDRSLSRRAERWAMDIADPDLDVFVADDDGVVGFASVGRSRDDDLPGHGELLTIYTLERVWGRGVGHALHGAAIGALRARGMTDGLLWVLDGNPAIHWYERQGWALDGSEKVETLGDAVLHERRMTRPL